MYNSITSWENWLGVMTEPFKHLAEKEEKLILKFLKQDFRVLEVGSGSGRLLNAISPHVKEIVGIEHEYLQVHVSEKILAKNSNIRVIFADGKNIPFEDNYFDLVIAVFNTLGNQGHDKFQVLKEMRRVTKDGGKVIVSVYAENAKDYQFECYKNYQNLLKQHGHKLNIVNIGDTIIFMIDGYSSVTSERFSKDKLSRLFHDTGFTKFDIEHLTDFVYVVNARK